MTCGCNDKCELPKALQINNPGEVTLFHRVDIPASQGDDTTYPPKNGLYRNVLLVYLANNHSYLYNSDGVPTRVDGPAGPGTAAGGETGQVLAKRSDADYDTTWVTQTSANDAKLTLTRNNTEIGDFTANASVDKTIDIEVPTKTSDLENDGATGESTYVEADELATVATSGSYTDLDNKPTIPTVNDATLTVTQNGTSKGTFTANSNANTTIALTDTTYSAGTGIDITGTTVAVDTSAVSMKSDYTVKKSYTIDLTAQSTSNFYPVVFTRTQYMVDCEIHSEGGGAALAYNQNVLHFQMVSQGWSDLAVRKKLIVLQEGAYETNEITIGCVGLGDHQGNNCVWLRGGIKYFFTCNVTAEAHTSTYTINDETFSVGTKYYGGTNANVTIYYTPQNVSKDVALMEDVDALTVTTAKIADRAVTATKIASGVLAYSTFEGLSGGASGYWKRLGNVTFAQHQQGKSVLLKILLGLGNNSNDHQQAFIDLVGQLAWTGSNNGRAGWTAEFNRMNNESSTSVFDIKVIANSVTSYDVYIRTASGYTSVTPIFIPGLHSDGTENAVWTPDYGAWTATAPSGTECDIAKTSVAMQADLPTKTSGLTNDGEDGTSTYVEEDELQPSYIEGEGTSITFTSTQGAQFKDIELKGDTKQGATLPSGYTQVEYIQNTTDAYFSFPFALTGADTVTMDIQLTGAGVSGWATLWSARTNSQTNTNTSFVDCTGGAQVRGDYANNQSSTTVTGATSRHVYQQARGNYFIDGVQKITRSATNFNTPTTTTIMASNESGGNIANYGRGKIYSLTIVRDYGLIHSFVPAVRNADSRAGLYDTVAGKFYVNAGTGQFTAGNPTPTPDVPQTVHTVTGEQTVSIIGDNLLEVTPSMLIVHGTYVSGANTDQFKVTATSTDLYLNQICAAGSTWSKAGQGNLIPCDYGETLYFTSGNTSFTKNLVTEYNEDKVSLGYYGLSAASGSFSPRFVGCKYVSVRFGYEPATVGTTYTLAPMVSRTSITEYEPYTNQEFKINLGKNLLNTAVLQIGFINDSGVLQYNTQSQTSAYIEVLPNTTYTASADATYRVIGMAEFTAGKTFIKRAESTNISSYSLTTTGSTKYIRVYYNKSATVTPQMLLDDKAQIEKGPARTDYSVYADQIELCKIGNYQDYIYQSGGNWYIHKVIDKVVDNGAKDYSARTNTSATYSKFYTSTDDLLGYPIMNPTALVSDYFIANIGANDAAYSGSAACGNSTSGYKKRLWYSVPNSIATTTSAIKTWLQSNPVTTYYVMETAMDVQITGSIANQLNALAGATGYRGTTAITATVPSQNLPAILSLSTALPSALPLATTTSVGMVSVGDGLEADANGRLSVKNVDNLVYASDPTTPIDNVADPYTYSTTETRIGTWIDGKPLYRRVFSGTASSANVSLSIGTGVVDQFTSVLGYRTTGSDPYDTIVAFYNTSSDYFRCWARKTGAGVATIELRNGASGYKYLAVVEYTKVSD